MNRETTFVRRIIQSSGRGGAKLRKKYSKTTNVLEGGRREWQ